MKNVTYFIILLVSNVTFYLLYSGTMTQTDQKTMGIKFDRDRGGKTDWQLTNEYSLISAEHQQEPLTPVRRLVFGKPSKVWYNVNHPTLPNRLQDTSWRVAHEILQSGLLCTPGACQRSQPAPYLVVACLSLWGICSGSTALCQAVAHPSCH